jgi:hypothetical protein
MPHLTSAAFVTALVLTLRPGPAEAARQPRQDRRDAALSRLTAELNQAMLAAATGQPIDPRWSGGADGVGLAATDPNLSAELTALGGEAQVVMTVMEIEGIDHSEDHPGYLRGSAVVLADGSVRWLAPMIRPGLPTVEASEGLETAAPALGAALERMAEALVDPACSLPLLHRDDVPGVPETLMSQLPVHKGALNMACMAAAHGGHSWRPRVDDVTLLVKVGEDYVGLRSALVIHQGALALEALQLRLMD